MCQKCNGLLSLFSSLVCSSILFHASRISLVSIRLMLIFLSLRQVMNGAFCLVSSYQPPVIPLSSDTNSSHLRRDPSAPPAEPQPQVRITPVLLLNLAIWNPLTALASACFTQSHDVEHQTRAGHPHLGQSCNSVPSNHQQPCFRLIS